MTWQKVPLTRQVQVHRRAALRSILEGTCTASGGSGQLLWGIGGQFVMTGRGDVDLADAGTIWTADGIEMVDSAIN
jgi:hypothetical protein